MENSLFFLIAAGIIQGLTEFLPVSSSAHLALMEEIFSLDPNWRLTVSVFLHLGTLLALIFFFAPKLVSKIKERNYQLLTKITIASLPLLLAIPLREVVALSFASIETIGYFLLLTGILLLSTRFGREKREEINYGAAFLGGLCQLFSVFPGISRSGATISILLLLGVKGETAYEFSFLLALPAVLAANLYEAISIGRGAGLAFQPIILIGLFFSFLTGLIALHLLRRLVRKGKFYLFAFYLFPFGIFLILRF